MAVYLHSLNLYNAALFKKKIASLLSRSFPFPGNSEVLTTFCIIQTYICTDNQGKVMHTNTGCDGKLPVGRGLTGDGPVFLPGPFSHPSNSG